MKEEIQSEKFSTTNFGNPRCREVKIMTSVVRKDEVIIIIVTYLK
jgi:hypothetical protein